MAAEIIVDVGVEGDVKVSVNGCAGTSCLKETEALERALGKTTSDVKTADFSKQTIGVNRGAS